MGFDSVPGNEKAKLILKSELMKNKKSGTYLFTGYKGLNTFAYAIGFAQALNCERQNNDFCGVCSSCIRISKAVHPDFEIIEADGESVKIDKIREVIRNAGSSVYEGGKKIFLIKSIDKLRHESANALLKTIEEPGDGVFFLLLANSQDILPTIISRSIVIEIFPEKPEILGVEKSLYDFLEGDVDEAEELLAKNYDINTPCEYTLLGAKIKEYIETRDTVVKADIRKCADDFMKKVKYMGELEKIETAEIIEKSIGSNRWFLKELLNIYIKKVRNISKIEKLLEIKENINYNINTASTLYLFFLSI